jgi:LAO/AO transport system kinase
MGDGIQAAKAGILEIADVLCVNKADRDGADTTMRELRHMIALGERSSSAWEVPVVKSVASTGVGIPELLDLLDKHFAWLTESGELITRRERRAAEEISALAIAALKRRLSAQEPELLADLAKAVVEGQLDPHAAAAQWVERLLA